MTVPKFVEEFCEILKAPNTPGQLDRVINFTGQNVAYIQNNHRQLGDNLAGTDIFPILRDFIEYISSETSDRKRLEAADWLYGTLGWLALQSITILEALCRAHVPEIVARHCNVLHKQHKLDMVCINHLSLQL